MDQILKAVEILKDGGVVGIPTETVYGLAGSIESPAGIEKIFSVKERPFFDPLIVHVADINQAKSYASSWPKSCDALAKALWPGPVTFILKKNNLIQGMITAGLDTVGLRMPNHPIALKVIKALGSPIAAPSANKFKRTSPTSAAHVEAEFPEIFTLDGGECKIGIESTVLGFDKENILIYRPGMINKTQILKILSKANINVTVEYVESPVAPGHLKHHYMPKLPVIFIHGKSENISDYDLTQVKSELLENPGFWKAPDSAPLCARELYSVLREQDTDENTSIIIHCSSKYKDDDYWQGILNRLKKASTYTLIK